MNKKRIALSLGAAIAVIGAAGAVYAQVVPRGPSLAQVQERANAQFDRMDQNLDGQIDAADRAQRQRAAFDAADANSDGALAFEEFSAMRGARMERGMGRGERGEGRGPGRHGGGHEGGGREGGMGLAAMLLVSDANADQKLTKAEFDTGIARLFASADANDDGILTREEAMALRTTMRNQAQARINQQRPAPAPTTTQ